MPPTCIQIPQNDSYPPKKKALLIGITYRDDSGAENRPSDVQELKGPHKDVREMKDLLISHYGYKERDIVVLTDEPGYENLPTHKNIRKEAQALVEGANPGDRFFFHFAGHTGQIENKNNTEEDGYDECIISSDHEQILDNQLNRYLVAPLPPKTQLVAVFDSCHSETLLDLPHYHCNRVWVPWVSKGKRRTATLRNVVVRKLAATSPTSPIGGGVRKFSQTKRVSASSRVVSRKSSLSGLPSRERSKSKSLSLRTKYILEHAPELSPIDFTLSESPTHMFPCDGWCLAASPLEGPNVIALGSCEDSQETWEDLSGASMTQALVKLLRAEPHPTFRDLMIKISHDMHAKALIMHGRARGYRKRFQAFRARNPNKKVPQRDNVEMDNFQDPSLSSQKPLDMSTRLDL